MLGRARGKECDELQIIAWCAVERMRERKESARDAYQSDFLAFSTFDMAARSGIQGRPVGRVHPDDQSDGSGRRVSRIDFFERCERDQDKRRIIGKF